MKKHILTQKHALLTSLRTMDIGMLSDILDDNLTYQDVSKTTFLQKLNEIFLIFKRNENTELRLYKGKCVGGIEYENDGCTGYTLKGNNSDYYLNLIIKEENNTITDIFSCKQFSCADVKQDAINQMNIYVCDDEKESFKPSVEYLAKIQHIEKAYEELINTEKPIILDSETYSYWFKKYKELYDSIKRKGRYTTYNKFSIIYGNLEYYFGLLQYSDECRKALIEIEELSKNINLTENHLLKWLIKYEELGNRKIDFWDTSSFEIIDNKILKLSFRKIIVWLDYAEFEYVFNFENTFNTHVWTTLRSYGSRFEEKPGELVYTKEKLEEILKQLFEEMTEHPVT